MNGEVKKGHVADRVNLNFRHVRQTIPDVVGFAMSGISRQADTEISGTLSAWSGSTCFTCGLDYCHTLVDFQYFLQPLALVTQSRPTTFSAPSR